MAKKGKELDIGSVRVQVDPLIIAQRILARQKWFLFAVAFLGGIITLVAYLTTPKTYLSKSSIAIRTERGSETFFRNLVNTAMRDLNSNSELMLIINELDLFPSTRAKLPYELALRRMKKELKIQRSSGVVNVSFESKDPRQAQQVVAFITERVLGTFAKLIDDPLEGQVQALDRLIAELEPDLAEARNRLYEFKARHPTIALTQVEFVPQDSPLAPINRQIDVTRRNLSRCYAGRQPLVNPLTTRTTPAACKVLADKERKRAQLLESLTPQHPTVQRFTRDIARQRVACENARGVAARRSGGIAPSSSKLSQKRCVELQRAELAALLGRKADLEKVAIKKPKLQKEWRELSVQANRLESELRAVRESRGKKVEQRLLDANEFQENFSLVDPPRVPTLPHKPDRNQFLLIAMAIVAVLGLGIAAGREAFRQNFLNPQEFEDQSGLQLLAVLPEIRD